MESRYANLDKDDPLVAIMQDTNIKGPVIFWRDTQQQTDSNGHSHTYLQNAWLDWQCNPSNPNWEPTKVFTQGGAVTAGTPLYKFTTIASNGPYMAAM